MKGAIVSKYETLYRLPLAFAVTRGEKAEWRKSYRENIVCANDIEKAIAENYDGERLNTDCVKALIDKHGFSRLNWVLGATVLEHICDGRISEENKQWARKIGAVAENLRIDFCVNSHPGLVNLLVDSARKQWQELGFYDSSHCISEKDGEIDYTGRIVVLKAERLTDDYLRPEAQIFYAESGFGCKPDSNGRKVFGRFLDTDEQTYIFRSEIAGALKDENIPDWAKQKVEEFQQHNEMKMEGM